MARQSLWRGQPPVLERRLQQIPQWPYRYGLTYGFGKVSTNGRRVRFKVRWLRGSKGAVWRERLSSVKVDLHLDYNSNYARWYKFVVSSDRCSRCHNIRNDSRRVANGYLWRICDLQHCNSYLCRKILYLTLAGVEASLVGLEVGHHSSSGLSTKQGGIIHK
jgi:hypothetical protein